MESGNESKTLWNDGMDLLNNSSDKSLRTKIEKGAVKARS